jgi:hypothetical protein
VSTVPSPRMSRTLARQVGTSVGLAVLGALGVSVASADWARKVLAFPSALRAAAFEQSQHVAGAPIGAVTAALGDACRAAAVESFTHGYQARGAAVVARSW